jgi:methylated-DNA-[protein]-cysteine S-methyltransferase
MLMATQTLDKPITKEDIIAGRQMPGMNFHQRVWALITQIPEGKVATYADVARQLGTNGYRAVGQALNRNPYAPAVPCHRVVGSDGKLTGFAGGLPKKQKMLKAEGVEIRDGRVDLGACRYEW